MTTYNSQKSPLILIADDDRFTRLMLRQLLEREKYQVAEVEDGELCLAAYQQYKPDMVLLDAMMPVMDGFTCCSQLQQLNRKDAPESDRTTESIPILMITGLNDQASIDWAFKAGATDFVTKPIHAPALLQRIHRLLEASWAQKALRHSEQQYRSVVENIKEVIFQIDGDGNWTFLNPSWTRLTGFTVDESLGTNFLNYVHPDDQALHRELWQSVIVGQKACFQQELRYLTKAAECRWIEIHAHPTQGTTDKIMGISGSFQDITERLYAAALEKEKVRLETEVIERTRTEAMVRHALEKEQELGEVKSQIITTISHEFRTPLTTIQSSSELLKRYSEKFTDEKKLRHFQKIENAVEHMTQLLNDVILIGQAEAGQLRFTPTQLDLQGLCREVVEEFQSSLGNQHTLIFSGQGDAIQGNLDEKLLQQLLNHLIGNAVKYSPQGGTVRFDLVFQEDKVIFQIQDEGIGIPPEDRQRLFESFYRASNAGTIQGTGLGLAIVKRCVDLQGGQIQVESEVGAGTTVTVTLPLNSSYS
ncbi:MULTISPECIES: ATP-binding protein [unclassified Coleofasciculus]|uniref:hybrid sensor histidine kinase/response regulator n=1 Tax=unclassified Coleofasciculus TaxID=2692782 RepID=UPI001881EEA7|nr:MULTISPECIES: ATP-binding protein [unclassified Coleofasciculus]MBE9126196.1 response regulator [Coleofasciculus sp. LEGE 07081]MBE9149597.1 response regulator [Coleofasciculus sp. LEGE 07092]